MAAGVGAAVVAAGVGASVVASGVGAAVEHSLTLKTRFILPPLQWSPTAATNMALQRLKRKLNRIAPTPS